MTVVRSAMSPTVVSFDRMIDRLGGHAGIPDAWLGGWLGWRLYGNLDERQFRRLLAGLIAPRAQHC